MADLTSEKLSIENLKVVTVGIAAFATTAGKIFEDGEVGLSDLPHLTGIWDALKDFSEVDFKMVMPEIKDLDDVEMEELGNLFDDNFDLTNDSLEAKVEAGLEIVMGGVGAVMAFISISRKVKAN